MKQLKSTAILLLTAIIWGFAFVAQRVGIEYVGNFTFIATRYILGAISLIPIILIFEREEKNPEKLKRTIGFGMIAGLILFTASALQQFGIEITQSAGKAGFITGLYTVLVPIFGIFLKKRTNICTWIGAAFAVIGLYLLSVTKGESIGIGDIVLLIGAVFWTLHIIFIDSKVSVISPIKFSMTQFATSAVLGFIFALLFEQNAFTGIGDALVPILYAGIMSSGVAYTCQIIGQKDANPTYAAIILSTESVFSAVGGALLLNEVMSIRGYIGCALMFTGIVISQLKINKNVGANHDSPVGHS